MRKDSSHNLIPVIYTGLPPSKTKFVKVHIPSFILRRFSYLVCSSFIAHMGIFDIRYLSRNTRELSYSGAIGQRVPWDYIRSHRITDVIQRRLQTLLNCHRHTVFKLLLGIFHLDHESQSDSRLPLSRLEPVKTTAIELWKSTLYIPFTISHNESFKPWPGQAMARTSHWPGQAIARTSHWPGQATAWTSLQISVIPEIVIHNIWPFITTIMRPHTALVFTEMKGKTILIHNRFMFPSTSSVLLIPAGWYDL
jgi:hypothetical protein